MDDIFPGETLEGEHLNNLIKLTAQEYQIPLHYDLILNAQTQLKKHNYHVAIIEAETAFEVYVENTLIKIAVELKRKEETVKELEYPGSYDQPGKRLKGLDEFISSYRTNNKLKELDNFVGSDQYKEWDIKLYKVRNDVVHGGLRKITFEKTRDAIHSVKIAISKIEQSIAGLADHVQICADVNHLNNTAGKIEFN